MRELETNEISIVNGAGIMASALGSMGAIIGKVPDSIFKLMGIQTNFSEMGKLAGQSIGYFLSFNLIDGFKTAFQAFAAGFKFGKIPTTTS